MVDYLVMQGWGRGIFLADVALYRHSIVETLNFQRTIFYRFTLARRGNTRLSKRENWRYSGGERALEGNYLHDRTFRSDKSFARKTLLFSGEREGNSRAAADNRALVKRPTGRDAGVCRKNLARHDARYDFASPTRNSPILAVVVETESTAFVLIGVNRCTGCPESTRKNAPRGKSRTLLVSEFENLSATSNHLPHRQNITK